MQPHKTRRASCIIFQIKSCIGSVDCSVNTNYLRHIITFYLKEKLNKQKQAIYFKPLSNQNQNKSNNFHSVVLTFIMTSTDMIFLFHSRSKVDGYLNRIDSLLNRLFSFILKCLLFIFLWQFFDCEWTLMRMIVWYKTKKITKVAPGPISLFALPHLTPPPFDNLSTC